MSIFFLNYFSPLERYRIQSEQFEDLWLITNELILRLKEYFGKQGIKDFSCSFSGCMPLQEYFELIDHHFELRINGEKLEELLSERAVQFRAIQRRLLTRFKDKTPAPLQHLDTLLDGTYKQQATDVEVGSDLVPSITVKVTLKNRVVLQKAKLSVYVQPPLVLTCDQFIFEFIEPEMTSTVAFSVYLKRNYTPSELEGNAVVSYSKSTGKHSVAHKCKSLIIPLNN
uniref:Uncharacterized protein n=1 Tax=Castor canadensis TaxID=51338 RepID=A0A8C0WN90_CASCN